MVLEFLQAFGEAFDLKDEFPDGVSLGENTSTYALQLVAELLTPSYSESFTNALTEPWIFYTAFLNILDFFIKNKLFLFAHI